MHENCSWPTFTKFPSIHCIYTALYILYMYCTSYTASILQPIYCKYTSVLKCICSLICIFKKSVLIGGLLLKVYCTHTSLHILHMYCTSYTASILHPIYCKYTSVLKCICSVIYIFKKSVLIGCLFLKVYCMHTANTQCSYTVHILKYTAQCSIARYAINSALHLHFRVSWKAVYKYTAYILQGNCSTLVVYTAESVRCTSSVYCIYTAFRSVLWYKFGVFIVRVHSHAWTF